MIVDVVEGWEWICVHSVTSLNGIKISTMHYQSSLNAAILSSNAIQVAKIVEDCERYDTNTFEHQK